MVGMIANKSMYTTRKEAIGAKAQRAGWTGTFAKTMSKPMRK